MAVSPWSPSVILLMFTVFSPVVTDGTELSFRVEKEPAAVLISEKTPASPNHRPSAHGKFPHGAFSVIIQGDHQAAVAKGDHLFPQCH